MSKSKSLTGIFIIVFIMFVILLMFSIYSFKIFKSDFSRSDANVQNPIGVIEVNGAIMKSKNIVKLLFKAEKNKKLKALIIRINSPGGVVGPTQEIYHEIRRLDNIYTKSKGKKGFPVYASMGTMAASGGYYLSTACREIFANPGTLTGSIGVIMKFYDLSKLYKFAMVKPNVLKAGLFKDIGSEARPMTKEENKIMHSMLLSVRSQFINDILRTRKNKIKGDIQKIAQGQVYSGEEAYKLGLVDKLMGLWQAGRYIYKTLNLKGEFKLVTIKDSEKNYLDKIIGKIKNSVEDFKLQLLYGKISLPMFIP